tara:strand:- start:16523 stop:17443 length:921 start_codon:yes stop_codon:yes gene_type:complete
MGYFRHDEYVELTMHFKCNLKCEHCMIEGTMNWLKPESIQQFHSVLELNAREKRWKGVIFTGAEVTLCKDLTQWARQAHQNGFENVRIQTHGMKLADPDYCESLVDAGINEYFISVTAADGETHDEITGVPGSWEKTMAGMENLNRFSDIVMHTNTVITQRSYRQLSQVIQRLHQLEKLVQFEFWNYWPMSESDGKDLIVPHAEALPEIRKAIQLADQLGKEIEIKNFPECLLGRDSAALNNSQPKLIIDPAFWTEFNRNGFHQCRHRSSCQSTQCLGLNTAYINRYGWEADMLTPIAAKDDGIPS